MDATGYAIDMKQSKKAPLLYWLHCHNYDSKDPVLRELWVKSKKEAIEKLHLIQLLCAADAGDLKTPSEVFMYPIHARFKRIDYKYCPNWDNFEELS